MPYIMKTRPADNSTVDSRQVRRLRKRLAEKGKHGRSDAPLPAMLGDRVSSSKYMPHIGAKQRGVEAPKS